MIHKRNFDEAAKSASSLQRGKLIIPAGFNAQAYLQELMQQMPGFQGKYELSRQLAAAVGRRMPWTYTYLDNLRAGRQPISGAMRRALFFHSMGQFAPPEEIIAERIG
jgi:hypothetical protein